MAKKKSKKIRITLTSSPIGHKPNQRKTAIALGLTKISKTVEKEATPATNATANDRFSAITASFPLHALNALFAYFETCPHQHVSDSAENVAADTNVA